MVTILVQSWVNFRRLLMLSQCWHTLRKKHLTLGRWCSWNIRIELLWSFDIFFIFNIPLYKPVILVYGWVKLHPQHHLDLPDLIIDILMLIVKVLKYLCSVIYPMLAGRLIYRWNSHVHLIHRINYIIEWAKVNYSLIVAPIPTTHTIILPISIIIIVVVI